MSTALTFRHASTADKALVVDFLDEHWGAKHPLVHCDDFFAHYYCNGERLQFCFAEQDGAVVAIAGYILANKCEHPDIWVSIWCAVKGKNGAGLELMNALPELTGARHMACNNIRPKTMPFYTFLGYHAQRLPHFYRLARKATYEVARVAHQTILPIGGTQALTQIATAEQLARDFVPDATQAPMKDAWYLARRYFTYPRQTYDVHGAYEGNILASVLVTRTVAVGDVNVLRIVDYIGNPDDFAKLGGAIAILMQQANAEYAECYCFGIGANIFAKAGFCERTENDANIIPNYLTPPLYENTEYYFFTDTTENFTMFKADGDQDRPNVE